MPAVESRLTRAAAILVVAGESSGNPWVDRIFDLRVEDFPTPVAELRRLVLLQRVYLKLNEGDEWLAQQEVNAALAVYREATEMVPDSATNGEAAFWSGVTLVQADRVDEAMPFLARAYAQDEAWAELVRRLPASELLPDDEQLIARLIGGMQGK